MKIAVIVPIGYVDRWGYERHIDEYIGSFASRAALTVLCEQYRAAPGAAELAGRLPRTVLLCDERTWYELDASGCEVVDWQRVNDAENAGVDEARKAGCNATIMVSSNWYATPTAWANVETLCRAMVEYGEPYTRFPVRYQLGATLFHTDLLAAGILNLAHNWRYEEARTLTDGTDSAPDLRGDFSAFDECALVDVALDITIDELRDKMNARKCEHGWLPKRAPVFDWEGYWHGHYGGKFSRKSPSADVPQGVGTIVAAATRPEYVSNIVLRELGL